MTRILLLSQLGMFFLFGMWGGSFVHAAIESRASARATAAIAATLISLPPRALSEIRI